MSPRSQAELVGSGSARAATASGFSSSSSASRLPASRCGCTSPRAKRIEPEQLDRFAAARELRVDFDRRDWPRARPASRAIARVKRVAESPSADRARPGRLRRRASAPRASNSLAALALMRCTATPSATPNAMPSTASARRAGMVAPRAAARAACTIGSGSAQRRGSRERSARPGAA